MSCRIPATRRRLLQALVGGGMTLAAARVSALVPTPRQTRGPFYPRSFPPDTDNDLVHVDGAGTTARGTVTDIAGRVLERDGTPVAGALVEIWQCDANGRYHHSRDYGAAPDPGFQGYGRMNADDDGRYTFRTIRPVPYSGRTPHIHFAVHAPDGRELVTQMYVEGEPRNGRDWILGNIGDEAARRAVIVALVPASDGEASLSGRFDIVLAGAGGSAAATPAMGDARELDDARAAWLRRRS